MPHILVAKQLLTSEWLQKRHRWAEAVCGGEQESERIIILRRGADPERRGVDLAAVKNFMVGHGRRGIFIFVFLFFFIYFFLFFFFFFLLAF